MVKAVKLTKAQLKEEFKQKISDLESQLVHRCAYSSEDIENAGDKLMASGAVIEIRALGGRQIVKPTMIRDGLSKETIAAIKKDFMRSYTLATIKKPKE